MKSFEILTEQSDFSETREAGVILDENTFFKNIAEGELQQVKSSLANGISAKVLDKQGRSALEYAAFWWHPSIATILIVAGADVDYVDSNGNTALFMACSGKKENETREAQECVRIILERIQRSLVHYHNRERMTPLDIACKKGRENLVASLLTNAYDYRLDTYNIYLARARKYALLSKHDKIAANLELCIRTNENRRRLVELDSRLRTTEDSLDDANDVLFGSA